MWWWSLIQGVAPHNTSLLNTYSIFVCVCLPLVCNPCLCLLYCYGKYKQNYVTNKTHHTRVSLHEHTYKTGPRVNEKHVSEKHNHITSKIKYSSLKQNIKNTLKSWTRSHDMTDKTITTHKNTRHPINTGAVLTSLKVGSWIQHKYWLYQSLLYYTILIFQRPTTAKQKVCCVRPSSQTINRFVAGGEVSSWLVPSIWKFRFEQTFCP